MPTLGQKLRRLREERQMTQAEVSAKVHVTQGTYSLYEADKAKPSIPVLSRLADLYGLSVAVLDRSLLELPCFSEAPAQDAEPDAELQELLSVWRQLSKDQRQALLSIVRTWRNPKA